MTERTTSVFPVYSGTEEETRGIFYSPGLRTCHTFEPVKVDLTNIVREVAGTLGESEMLENGGRAYDDQYSTEMCTPECLDPRTHTVYIYAGAELFKEGVSSFLVRRTKESQRPYVGIISRRVIDDEWNTWACHDNYSIRYTSDYAAKVPDRPEDISRLWYGFLRSRAFITGAGLVGEKYLHYSQKLFRTANFNDAGYKARMLKVRQDPEQRLEIGCSDINLKEWSTMARIGGAALFLALTQTPLTKKLLKLPEFHYEGWGDFTNIIDIDSQDMQFRPRAETRYLLDMQRAIISTTLKELESAANEPMPPLLKAIAKAELEFCNDFEAVLDGTKDLAVLTDRADWAQKVFALRRDAQKDRVKGVVRTLLDDRARDLDKAYDRTVIKVDAEGTVTRIEGYGTRKAEQASTITPEEILDAMFTPPPGTRAARRVEVAKELGRTLKGCDWQQVKVDVGKKRLRTIPIDYSSAA